MRLLVVSYWCPAPPDNGSRLRAYHLIRQLARQGNHIRLLTMTQPETDMAAAAEALASFCAAGVEMFPSRVVFQPSTIKAMLGFLTPRPRHVLEMFHAEFADAVARECQHGQYEALLALELGAAHYVPANVTIPCILDQLEVSPFVKGTQEASSMSQRVRRQLTLAKLRAHVRDLGRRYAQWTAVSEAEAKVIQALAGGAAPPIQILPNGVDLRENGFLPHAEYDQDVLIYNGALTFSANADAVRWFVAEILPMIQEAEPQMQLRVTGRNATLADNDPLRTMPGVTLTGFLPDVRPAVRSALACVVPLRQGGGTRLKILEAMALGVPVVATRRGAEGLAATPDEEILIADAPADFAAAVLRLRHDPELRGRLGAAGRRLVESRYGWDALGAQLHASLQMLASKKG